MGNIAGLEGAIVPKAGVGDVELWLTGATERDRQALSSIGGGGEVDHHPGIEAEAPGERRARLRIQGTDPSLAVGTDPNEPGGGDDEGGSTPEVVSWSSHRRRPPTDHRFARLHLGEPGTRIEVKLQLVGGDQRAGGP